MRETPQIVLPEAYRFEHLFYEFRWLEVHRKSKAPAPYAGYWTEADRPEEARGLVFCDVSYTIASGGMFWQLWVRPLLDVRAASRRADQNDRITYEIITQYTPEDGPNLPASQRTGKTLVVAKHSGLAGFDDWLAYIDPASIPLPPVRRDPAEVGRFDRLTG